MEKVFQLKDIVKGCAKYLERRIYLLLVIFLTHRHTSKKDTESVNIFIIVKLPDSQDLLSSNTLYYYTF